MMLNENIAADIMTRRFPKSKILDIVETENYYICHLDTDDSGPGRYAVNKKTKEVEKLNIMQLTYELQHMGASK